jgi:hypothetical protein
MLERPEEPALTAAANDGPDAPQGEREPWTTPQVFVSEMRDGRNSVGVIYEVTDVRS